MKILLVEDDPKVARFVTRGLTEEGFMVDHASDGEEGRYLAENGRYDLIILDVLLPYRDGFEVLARLRRAGMPTRVLMLTARDSIEDRVRGLNEGADDFLVKPFAFAELVARIRALMRRPIAEQPSSFTIDTLEVDTRRHSVKRQGQPIPLTAKEYAVLEYLIRHQGQIVTRTRLAEQIWDENFDPMSNVIDVTVYHLREKIDKGYDRRLIHTVRGAGYVLRDGE